MSTVSETEIRTADALLPGYAGSVRRHDDALVRPSWGELTRGEKARVRVYLVLFALVAAVLAAALAAGMT